MRNRILKSAWMLAVCLPTLAMAQQQPGAQRGEGTWEFSLGGGISILDRALRGFLGSGAPESRFANTTSPSRVTPAATARVGYNFTPNLGVSVGGTAAGGSGLRYLTPSAAVTYTWDLSAETSPFVLVGTELTRVDGINGRTTHSTWGAMGGVGVRHMVGENLALRLEGRMRLEGYQELATGNAFTSVATLGLSYFVGGRRPVVVARAAAQCPVCALGRARVDTIVRTRYDTVRATRVDTVRVRVIVPEPSPDQLVLRVQFRTNVSELLPISRPVLDTIAFAIIATPNSRWEVQGHTDSIGSAELNRNLAQARAQTVVDYLVSRGVDRSIMTAVGFGPDRPVFSNSTVYGRAQNRRVQLRRVPPPPTGQPVP